MTSGLVRQAWRYAITGLLNTCAGLLVVFIASALGRNAFLANACGYLAGFVLGFVFNRAWTFNYSGHVLAAAIRYVVACAISYLLNLVVLVVALKRLHLPEIVAQGFALSAYSVSLFLICRTVVFRADPKGA